MCNAERGSLPMTRVVRLVKISTGSLLRPESADGLHEYEMLPGLSNHVVEQPSIPALPDMVMACGYLLMMASSSGAPEADIIVPIQPSLKATYPKTLYFRPVGRLMPMTVSQATQKAPLTVRTLRPIASGETYRLISSKLGRLVRPELAEALKTVFERFAREHGFTPENPLEIRLMRGFQAGSHGHAEGRAADIAAVGSKGLLEWKQEWDRAMTAAEEFPDSQRRIEAMTAEQKRNLGYRLYRALQEHSGWRVDSKGWQPYRGVMQLFGPWTATEGPWRTMHIKDPSPYQQQRLADQKWVFQAHQDHIHVAR
jgi:hypothetical protein